MIFWFCLAQEILFTLEDLRGDLKAGLCTTATRLGRVVSLRLFQCTVLVFIAFAFMPWYFGLASHAYIAAAVTCTIIPVFIAAFSLRKDSSARSLRMSADGLGIIWWTSVVPFVLLR